MNNEKFDDMTKSDNTMSLSEDDFVNSWKFPKTCTKLDQSFKNSSNQVTPNLQNNCDLLFKKKTSYFASCFEIVNPLPFYDICLKLSSLPYHSNSSENLQKAACTAGLSYIEACAIENLPLRVPDSCIQCKLDNGSFITEGEFVTIKEENITPAVDVVFVMESRSCNVETTKKKLLLSLVSSMVNEFKYLSVVEPRFAVVPFGAEFQKPSSITLNGQVFTNDENIHLYFNHLKDENGTSDVFTALTVASKLAFKPGAAKILVLSLCTKCEFNLLKVIISFPDFQACT
jgi:hypothetical protein